MLNHARTLLLNIDGRNTPGADFPGEEGVPLGYRPFVPPGYLAAVRSVLFGQNPDRMGMNYRLEQYMSVLHATELKEHVLALDDRISYVPGSPTSFADDFGVTASGSPKVISFVGQYEADETLGRLRQEWRVSVGNGGTATVLLITPPVRETQYDITVSNNISNDVPLDRGLACNFDPTPGNFWYVTASARPSRGLPEIVEALRTSLSDTRLLPLFGAAPAEPYKTFKALWDSHPFLPYQLGGLLLATVYRSNEVWGKETQQ